MSRPEPAAEEELRREIDQLEAALAIAGQPAGSTVAGPGSPGDHDDAVRAVRLADLYGVLGGTLRRAGEHRQAAAAYDRGFRLESDPRYAMRSTYNALNRLTTRILLCPGCLADPGLLRADGGLGYVNVADELAGLRLRLTGELAGARADDFWAAGDLSVTSALCGDDAGMERGRQEFVRLSPPQSALAAYREGLAMLARLDTPRADLLRRAVLAWTS